MILPCNLTYRSYFIEEFKQEYAEYPDVEIKIKKSVTKIKTEEACDDKNEPMLDY